MSDPDKLDLSCPVCGQGGLAPINLRPFPKREFWICTECEALWEQAGSPAINGGLSVCFDTFMQSHGYDSDWSHISGATCYVFEGKIIGLEGDSPSKTHVG